MLSGRTIQAVTGAIFGPILGGLLWRRTKNIYLVFVGEVVGTGLLGAMASYPLMKLFYGLDAQSPFYYIPFYTPAAAVGAGMGVAVGASVGSCVASAVGSMVGTTVASGAAL